jgi:capsid protein
MEYARTPRITATARRTAKRKPAQIQQAHTKLAIAGQPLTIAINAHVGKAGLLHAQKRPASVQTRTAARTMMLKELQQTDKQAKQTAALIAQDCAYKESPAQLPAGL